MLAIYIAYLVSYFICSGYVIRYALDMPRWNANHSATINLIRTLRLPPEHICKLESKAGRRYGAVKGKREARKAKEILELRCVSW